MKPLKIVLIVLGVLVLSWVLMLGTCVGGLYFATRGVATAGDDWVRSCGGGKLHECWSATGGELRAGDEKAFVEDARQRGLDRARATSWTNRQIENSSGHLVGSATLDDGREVPLELLLSKIDGQWRVTGMR